jgi:phospholipid/cholesterol/gamma-HCH transport system substrate-binding protein
MENRAHALLAGIFTVLLVAAVIGFALWLGRDTTIRKSYTLVAQGSVNGLKEQAPVRFRGYEVGRVTDIKFDPKQQGGIVVEIAVLQDTPVSTNTYAELGLLGITGLSFVQLLDKPQAGAAASRLLEEDARLTLRPSIIDRISADGEVLVAKANAAMTQVEKLVGEESQRDLRQALVSIDGAAKRFNTLADAYTPLAQEAKPLLAEARKTIANANGMVSDLRGQTTALVAKFDAPLTTITSAASSFDVASKRFTVTSDRWSGLASAVETQTLPVVGKATNDARQSVRSIGRAADTFSDAPSSILFGSPARRPGPGEPGFSFAEANR